MKTTLLLLALALALGILGCAKTEAKPAKIKPIDEIYVYHSTFGRCNPEYKIDLKNKQLWGYTSPFTNFRERDITAENEGYTLICDLSDDKIEAFMRDAEKYGLARWEGDYIEEGVLDGHQWEMTITFSDSTKLVTGGSNAYPASWNDIREALEEATGTDILIYEGS